ncbi:hypothetical protein M422DRAFT_276766 [Sphaerobolus stellatus SS14]|uniref:Heme haloperoxidase family profile domain-containing protein n=1 Tax=Sphaerobolus stellatus (strain SS14) TaxID=990650 RepID=A0A0C9U174_SPHS4|nr:hypothetical protein M422DRAFT_276766 [Sphaerobolus stellatus SS14]
MVKFVSFLLLVFVRVALAFPTYESLAGVSEREINEFIARDGGASIPNPPGPLADDSLKLVADAAHPFIAPGPNDLPGSCPGMNTLANHGYIPRNGVARPDQIITAVMEAFNFGNDFAKFVVYQALLLDGNPLTNLLSIGKKTHETGPDPPKPALVGGLSQHNTFEGDTSMTRVEAFFGDSFVFNEELFQKFISFCEKFGFNGTYDIGPASELRHQRLQDSIQTSPQLVFIAPRILSTYSEATLPCSSSLMDVQTTVSSALTRFPQISPLSQQIFDKHPFTSGVNQGVNNFVLMPNTPALTDFCGIYKDLVNRVIASQHPNPTGALKKVLNKNLTFLFDGAKVNHNCTQEFPFGTDN